MLSRARVALFIFALALALLAAGSVVAPAAAGPEAQSVGSHGHVAGTNPADAQAVEADDETETVFRVELRPDGDARWTITRNFSVADEDDRSAFEQLAAEWQAGGSSETMRSLRRASAEASVATGREMSITDVQRSHEVYNDTGQLVVTFTWTNFSRTTGDRLHVDDVFNTTRGTWFKGLEATQALVVVPPDNHSLVNAGPAGYKVSEGTLRWDGELTFEPGDLSVTYREVPDDDPPFAMLALVIGGFGVVAALAYAISKGGFSVPVSTTGDGSDDDHDEEPAAPQGTADGGDAGAPATAGTETGDDAVVDVDLLSDEERIERLLDRNGGRMKQANIVKETGWSNAKVSQLLSSMDDADRIDKLRIGRENLISFPDEDVTDTNGNEP
jgi:hypothetical protein